MSVFMCSPAHIGLLADQATTRQPAALCVLLADRLPSPYTPDDQRAVFARAFHDMNETSLVARYGRDHGMGYEYETPPRFGAVSAVVLAKQLACYLYQCCEGDVDTTDLYLAVSAWHDSVARHAIGVLPEYDRAPWGV
jgi:hypothetical protein